VPPAYIRVRNFSRYQHYKNRNPPWVKLYNSLLDDYSFGRLQDASKWLAVGLTLLASRTENHIPADPEWLSRRLSLSSPPNIDDVLSSGFAETCQCHQCLASGALASCKRNGGSETERETEERESREEKNGSEDTPGAEPPRRLPPLGFDKNGKALTEQQTRIQAAERAIFLQRGHVPPPAPSIAKWLELIDEDGLISVIEQLEGSGKMEELKDAGQKRTAYIFACVKSFAADCARLERGLPS
jgi:hypothetical protein